MYLLVDYFSMTLLMLPSKLMWRLFCGKSGFLFGFGICVIVTSFHVFERNRTAGFMIFVRCVIAFRGGFLKTIYLMLSWSGSFHKHMLNYT